MISWTWKTSLNGRSDLLFRYVGNFNNNILLRFQLQIHNHQLLQRYFLLIRLDIKSKCVYYTIKLTTETTSKICFWCNNYMTCAQWFTPGQGPTRRNVLFKFCHLESRRLFGKFNRMMLTIIRLFSNLLYFLSLPNAILSTFAVFVMLALSDGNYDEIEFLTDLKLHFLHLLACLIFYVPSEITTYVISKKFVDIQFSKWNHWMILSLQTMLISRLIVFFLLIDTELYEHNPPEIQCMKIVIFSTFIQMCYHLYMFKPDYLDFKHFWSPLSDTYQALWMVAYQISPKTPKWVNILVAVAVILLMILSFSDIYRYRFPQLARMVPREAKNAQFVLFCVLLVARFILLVELYGIGDLIFTARLLYRFVFQILPEFIFELFEHALYTRFLMA